MNDLCVFGNYSLDGDVAIPESNNIPITLMTIRDALAGGEGGGRGPCTTRIIIYAPANMMKNIKGGAEWEGTHNLSSQRQAPPVSEYDVFVKIRNSRFWEIYFDTSALLLLYPESLP